MLKLVLSLLMLLGLLAQGEASCDSYAASHANGCSIPFNLPYFFKRKFTPSCNIHDVCYACAASHGHSKVDCDIAFYNRIRRVCGSVGRRALEIADPEERRRFLLHPEQDFCRLVSASYYEAVKHFGASHYSSTGHSAHCSSSWVSGCIP